MFDYQRISNSVMLYLLDKMVSIYNDHYGDYKNEKSL